MQKMNFVIYNQLDFVSFRATDQEVESNDGNLQREIDALNNQTKLNCNADFTNSFYGDRGALFCLHNKGDVAILDLQNIYGLICTPNLV